MSTRVTTAALLTLLSPLSPASPLGAGRMPAAVAFDCRLVTIVSGLDSLTVEACDDDGDDEGSQGEASDVGQPEVAGGRSQDASDDDVTSSRCDLTPEAATRILPDGSLQQVYSWTCGAAAGVGWVPVVDDNGAYVPQVTPQDLIPIAYANASALLPLPIPRIGPADWDPQGFTYVQIPTVFWVDQAPGQWAPVSATASIAGLSLTATATPVSLHVDAGDGGSVDCPGAPPPFRPDLDDIERFAGCTYTYRNSSAMSGNGQTYPVTVTITWDVTWSASTGESGALGTLATTSDVRALPVAEIQAIVVAN